VRGEAFESVPRAALRDDLRRLGERLIARDIGPRLRGRERRELGALPGDLPRLFRGVVLVLGQRAAGTRPGGSLNGHPRTCLMSQLLGSLVAGSPTQASAGTRVVAAAGPGNEMLIRQVNERDPST
jgi:hypothetical protein